MTPSAHLVERLVADFPSLATLLADHRVDQNGETLPYLFMADVARWAQQDLAAHPDAIGDVVDWLEREFVLADPAEKDLIGLGFVEAISYPPDGAALLLRLGPQLTLVAGQLGLLPSAD